MSAKRRFVVEVDEAAAEALAVNAESCKCSVEQVIADAVADCCFDERGSVHVTVDGRGWTITVDSWAGDHRIEGDVPVAL